VPDISTINLDFNFSCWNSLKKITGGSLKLPSIPKIKSPDLHVRSRGGYVQIRLLDDKIYRYSIAVGWIRRAGSPAVASYRGQKPITFPAFAQTLV
jgi:hypothetical protein